MGRTKGGIRALREVRALKRIGASLLTASDFFIGPWRPASSFCSPVGSAGGLLQRLCQARDPGAIAMEI